MAVTSVKILHNGWSGSDTAGGGITFNVVYLVEVNDKNDGPLVVLNASGLPMVGDSYEVGNDRDDFAFVKSVSPSPIADMMWNVVITFGPLEPSDEGSSNGSNTEGLDKEGKPTDDPLEIAARMSVSSVLAKRAATNGAYFGRLEENAGGDYILNADGFNGDKPPVVEHPTLWNADEDHGSIRDKTPITNSVFTPYDPPPEIDYSRTRLTINMNLRPQPDAPWRDFLSRVNSINKDNVYFEDAFGDTVCMANMYSARVMGVSYEERLMNNKMFWSTQIDILIDNLFGWRLDILDRGYCDTTNEGVSEGATKKNIVDKNGLPLAEPVLLNGQGAQLNIETDSAVYLQYGVYPEISFINDFPIKNPQAFQDKINNQ